MARTNTICNTDREIGPDAVAVSFPADYWDYVGWRDTLASPAFTARQKAYAAAHGKANRKLL